LEIRLEKIYKNVLAWAYHQTEVSVAKFQREFKIDDLTAEKLLKKMVAEN